METLLQQLQIQLTQVVLVTLLQEVYMELEDLDIQLKT
jgi:hypothetical protein